MNAKGVGMTRVMKGVRVRMADCGTDGIQKVKKRRVRQQGEGHSGHKGVVECAARPGSWNRPPNGGLLTGHSRAATPSASDRWMRRHDRITLRDSRTGVARLKAHG
jgi:hypothetical protein